MVSEEVCFAIGNCLIQFLTHVIYIGADSILYIISASRAKNEYRHCVSDAESCMRFLCCLWLSCVVANGPELFLMPTPDKSVFQQIVFYLLWFSAEGIAQRLQTVKLFVSQKHVDARNQYCRVFWQIVHLLNKFDIVRNNIFVMSVLHAESMRDNAELGESQTFIQVQGVGIRGHDSIKLKNTETLFGSNFQ